jgi:hypothetical protein
VPLVAADVRLTNDSPTTSGYISAYTLATGNFYTDAIIQECWMARGRQNEPAVAMNPRDARYRGQFERLLRCLRRSPANAVFVASGPIWLGY